MCPNLKSDNPYVAGSNPTVSSIAEKQTLYIGSGNKAKGGLG
jgi:hypothetical protein